MKRLLLILTVLLVLGFACEAKAHYPAYCPGYGWTYRAPPAAVYYRGWGRPWGWGYSYTRAPLFVQPYRVPPQAWGYW